MKSNLLLLAIVVQVGLAAHTASAHPGSGIVVDPQGQVFFQDSAGRTIWKIDTRGKLTSYHDKLGGHWMALDVKGRFARSDVRLVERISPSGVTPALLVGAGGGGAPITVNADGYLYYGAQESQTGEVSVGMMRAAPSGQPEVFAQGFAHAIEKLGVTGLASGPDGTIYVACLTDVMKVTTNGVFTKLVGPVVVKDCDADGPNCFLQGLDVDSRGTVYAAATGCRCVVKITADGKVETVLRAERPWSPTGVAMHDGAVFVLEYTNPNGHLTEGWLPRVRKLGSDGRVTTLATISAAQQRAQPHSQVDVIK